MKRHLATLAAAVALTVVAATAWAYWSAGSVPGGSGAAAASGVNPGATPNASAVGSTVTVSWSATTLANGQPVGGYLVKRYDAGTQAAQTILSACTGTIATTSCVESGVPNGSWKYAVTPVFATQWQGPESAKSATVVVNSDATAPTNSISLSSVTGGAHLTGTTIYYRGTAAGSLRLTNAVADAGSGPASSSTAALTGTSTGWSHTPSTISTPAGGPYVSSSFDWAAGTTSSPAEAVTGRDVAGNTAVTNLSFTNDSTAPTAGTISYADGFASGRSASITFASGTDAGAGIATRRLQRAVATLNGTSCATFGSFNDIGADSPTSPYVDGSLQHGCYRYRYVVTDRVGNQDVATSANVVKVSYAGAVNATAGLLSHWRLGDTATAAPVSTDTFTGPAGSQLAAHTGELAASWVRQAGSANATISDQGRIYRDSLLGGYTLDTASLVPANADYSVEADLVLRSRVSTDVVGVIGRLTGSGTHYAATWQESNNSWNLLRYPVPLFGTSVLASVASQPDLNAGQAYRLKLEMVGSTLKLYVDGVLKVTATDSSITQPGLAGVMDGNREPLAANPAKNNSTGIHLDNFEVTSTYRAFDSKSTNHGQYVNGVTRGASGALAGDSDTAAQFDGVNDYVQMTSTTGIPTGGALRSTELWFKTTSAAQQVLFRYGSGFAAQEYGLWLNSGGTAMTAWGHSAGNDKVFTMPYAVNDGAWHQVVKTFGGGMVTLYIDGVALPAQSTTRNTVMDVYGFAVGAVLRPGDGNSGGYFNGSIDEVSFYTSVLTQAQVTDHYQLGAAPAIDGAGPTGGSVDSSGLVGNGGRYSTSATLNLALTKGTDPSGLAASGNTLSRATATLTGGTCGTFGSYALITGGNDPVSPKSDSVSDQACYRYRYIVSDTLGNTTTYTSPDIKVDTTAPAAPTLGFTAFSNTYWPGSGTTVYYRSTATSGSVTTTATTTDVTSGILSYAFPGLGTNWTSTPGALGVSTYSWSGAPAAPGAKTVTATNNAGLASANAPFTMTADDAAPTAGTVSYVDGSTSGTTVSVSFTTGTDSGSGLGTRLLQRAAAPVTGTTCGTYGAFATVTNGTDPTSPVTDTIAPGNCYQYRYVVPDRVGNQDIATSANVAHLAFGAHWAFDAGSGTSATDSTGNGNTATLQAGATWTAGKVGANALNLNGTTQFASAPAPVIDTSQSYTVAAWVRPSSITGNNRTAVALEGSSISPFYLMVSGAGQYRVEFRHGDSTGSAVTVATGVAAAVNTWAHLAAVHDNAANTVSLYVDGVLRSTVAFNSPWKANGVTTVGRARFNGAPVDFFSGAIDDVRLYDRVLSGGEVAAMVPASYGTTINATPGLVSYWRMGESSGTTMSDSKGVSGGTYFGGPTLGGAGAVTGNTAMQVNGSSQYATAPRPIQDDFSIEFWFKSSQTAGSTCTQWWQGMRLVDAEVGGGNSDFGVSLCLGKVIGGVGSFSDVSIVSPLTYNDNAWHHVVFTRTTSPAAMQLYIDGASVASGTPNNTGPLTASSILAFGRAPDGSGFYYSGLLDEVAVYSTVLSPATISAHYTAAS